MAPILIFLKYSIYFTAILIGLLLAYYHKIKEFPLNTSIVINKISKEKVCGLLKHVEFLRFHPRIKEINFIEKTRINDTVYDVYEISEELVVLMGLYKLKNKALLYVEKIDDCKIKTHARIPFLIVFEVQVTSVISAKEIENSKGSFLLEEEMKISGIYYLITLIKGYSRLSRDILFGNIKTYLDSLG